MSRLDQMRKAIADQQAATAKKEISAEAKARDPKKAKMPDRPKGPQVTYKCGHRVGVKNLEEAHCPACRNKARKASNIERQKLIMEKSAKDSQRLPEGSQFHASYNADRKRWTGTLTIWHGTANMQVFTDDSGAVMKLLGKLDNQYRAWLASQSSQAATQ